MARKRPVKKSMKTKPRSKAGADLLDRDVELVAKLADLPLNDLRQTYPHAAATIHRGALTRGQAMTEILYDEFREEFAEMSGDTEAI
jgi:hypothetical protein